jgi:hypothetical protein
VEIPAPVSAVTRSAARIQFATSSAVPDMVATVSEAPGDQPRRGP